MSARQIVWLNTVRIPETSCRLHGAPVTLFDKITPVTLGGEGELWAALNSGSCFSQFTASDPHIKSRHFALTWNIRVKDKLLLYRHEIQRYCGYRTNVVNDPLRTLSLSSVANTKRSGVGFSCMNNCCNPLNYQRFIYNAEHKFHQNCLHLYSGG
jgi:hypothetical protein